MQFWRGAEGVAQATPLRLSPGGEVAGIDFRLRFAHAATIKVRISGLPDAARASATPRLISRNLPGIADHAYGFVHSDQPGTFEFRNVLRGAYTLLVNHEAGGGYRSQTELNISGGEDLDLEVTAAPATPLGGTLISDQPLKGVRVQLVPGDPLPGYLHTTLKAEVQPDGSFQFPSVMPGVWDIGVENLPVNAYVPSMMLGQEDVLTKDMIINGAVTDSLKLTISHTAGIVRGTTSGPALLLLAPDGDLRSVLGFYHLAGSDDKGVFEIKSVRPGNYKLFAIDAMDSNEWMDPEFLARIEGQGVKVVVTPGGAVEVEPSLIHRPVE
jgi:hypothetical protein